MFVQTLAARRNQWPLNGLAFSSVFATTLLCRDRDCRKTIMFGARAVSSACGLRFCTAKTQSEHLRRSRHGADICEPVHQSGPALPDCRTGVTLAGAVVGFETLP